MGNPRDGGEPHLTGKILLISPTKKIPFNKFLSSPIKSVTPSLANDNFHLISL